MKENKKSVSTRRASSHCKASKEKQEDFIMLPTVDFCFKELMQNDKIRKNIIAALLNVPVRWRTQNLCLRFLEKNRKMISMES
jgi:hypothetical protein